MNSIKSDPKILDGKATANSILADVGREIFQICEEKNLSKPVLEILLIGENPASQTYVRNKVSACKRANIQVILTKFEENITQDKLLQEIRQRNESDIDGFIVQLPLPPHIEVQSILDEIHPDKDVDGFHPLNFGKMALGLPSMKPATPYGILKLIKANHIYTKGKHVVVVGRSNLVGKPMAIMLGNDFEIGRATVTSCDINTPRELLLDEIGRADIVIVAVGKPGLITGRMLKPGSIIIDVGINKLQDGTIVGDVDFDSVYPKCSLITPVPGGVGPMTVAALIINTLNSWKSKQKLNKQI